ncbi:hypothetical protein BDV12DRAFT_208029 [Aspergillus spectabilis]
MTSVREIFALSREQVRLARPYGTIRLTSRADGEEQNATIQRFPIPSSDPLDPLNWPMWLKAMSLTCMSLYAFATNLASASLSSAFPLMATPLGFDPPRPIGDLSYLVSVNVLMVGVANILWVPLAGVIGRRPVILLGVLLLTVSSVWAASTRNFGSYLTARIIMGTGGAAADTVAPIVIGEIFFTHERGRCMAIYTVMLASAPLIGGISGGYIAANLGVPWINWINAIISGALLVLCVFFQPETLFIRPPPQHEELAEPKGGVKSVQKIEGIQVQKHPEARPVSYLAAMRVWTYRPGFWSRLLESLLAFRLPGTWVVMLWYGALIAGLVTMSTVGPTLVASPPYLWGQHVGLINVGGAVGVILGLLLTVPFADWILNIQARRSQNGYVEAESRLPIAVPGLFLATAGMWTFGFCAAHPSSTGWVGMQFGIGMVSFGVLQVPSIGFNYILDAYGPASADCFLIITVVRAIISFCWTFFAAEWVTSAGPAVPFGVFGGIMGLFSFLMIPLIVWGKRLRILTDQWVPKSAI